VFNYENICTAARLQVHLLLYSGRIDSWQKSRMRLNLPTTGGKKSVGRWPKCQVLAVTGISDY